jgi:sugar phosphate isomerase/epimerase
LDHLTAIETTPLELAETASQAGYNRICAFVRSIDGLGGPSFNLAEDRSRLAATRTALGTLDITVDFAYPFTISDRSLPGDFEADLASAAELGARMVNLLVFARDPRRIRDDTASFCERARAYSLGVALEMVPASTVRTLTEAASLVGDLGEDADIGINLDVLHLYRSGDRPMSVVPFIDKVRYLQLCDGPLEIAAESRRAEASMQRLLPGHGAFDLHELIGLLNGVPASLEIPDAAAKAAGLGPIDRARAARTAARAIPA